MLGNWSSASNVRRISSSKFYCISSAGGSVGGPVQFTAPGDLQFFAPCVRAAWLQGVRSLRENHRGNCRVAGHYILWGTTVSGHGRPKKSSTCSLQAHYYFRSGSRCSGMCMGQLLASYAVTVSVVCGNYEMAAEASPSCLGINLVCSTAVRFRWKKLGFSMQLHYSLPGTRHIYKCLLAPMDDFAIVQYTQHAQPPMWRLRSAATAFQNQRRACVQMRA